MIRLLVLSVHLISIFTECAKVSSCRELLVSIRFDGPGWQWSGSFFPDRLGDVQLKMRNSASGVSNMIRVEVQNADIDVHSNKFAGRNNSNTGTILILLSDDKTGFVPYRVDNFSMEVTSSCCVVHFGNCKTLKTNNSHSIISEIAYISAEM
jgi:hypothetical protein